MKANRIAFSLRTRLTSVVILTVVISLWVLTLSITRHIEQDIRVLLEAQQYSTVSYIAADIEAKITQRIELLEQNAKLVSQYFHAPGQTREFLKGRIGLQALFQEGVVIIDKEGLGIAEFPAGIGRENADFS